MKRETTFEEWLRSVDTWVSTLCGMGLDDLPDCPTHDWYDEGITPMVAAKRAIRRAKGF
jgi:hypothetical protein